MKKGILNIIGKILGLYLAFLVGKYIICEASMHIPFACGYIVMAIYIIACIKVGQFCMDKLIKLALYLSKYGEKSNG